MDQIIQFLGMKGYYVQRMNSGMVRLGEGRNSRMIRMNRAGTPDVLAIKNGHATWIEVKRPKMKPTPLQEQVMQELKDIGCTVFVATCIEDVEKAIRQY